MSTEQLVIRFQDIINIFNQSTRLEIGIAVAVIVVTSVVMFAACCCICCRKTERPRQLRQSSRIPHNNVRRKTGWDISPHLVRSEIGVNFNEWRMPKAKWGPYEPGKMSAYTGDLDIKQTDWRRATEAVDAVLAMLLQEIRTEAERNFPKLRIGNFIRQGSSREGLKVSMADEFDALLLFTIEGITFKVCHLKDEVDRVLPEFGQLVADGFTESRIEYEYQKLYSKGVFDLSGERNKVRLNSRNLHEKVFKSIIMSAANTVETRVNTKQSYERFSFAIQKFSINPPSVNIQIKLVEKDGYYDYGEHLRTCLRDESMVLQSAVETLIDVDIVPGIELGRDRVPDPTDWNETMECPRYAVFKWFTENQPFAMRYYSPPDILWRMCSSGYEKHVLDVSRGSKEQSYIVTALRIMKREFRDRKTCYTPLQVVTVLRSYHLKHIAFYCILYLTTMNKTKLSGVREALAYFLEFLEVCLEEGKLPHFFHANALLVYMFPEREVDDRSLRYDLFSGKSRNSLLQAGLSFRSIKRDITSKYSLDSEGICAYKEYSDAFKEFVKTEQYYEA